MKWAHGRLTQYVNEFSRLDFVEKTIEALENRSEILPEVTNISKSNDEVQALIAEYIAHINASLNVEGDVLVCADFLEKTRLFVERLKKGLSQSSLYGEKRLRLLWVEGLTNLIYATQDWLKTVVLCSKDETKEIYLSYCKACQRSVVRFEKTRQAITKEAIA